MNASREMCIAEPPSRVVSVACLLRHLRLLCSCSVLAARRRNSVRSAHACATQLHRCVLTTLSRIEDEVAGLPPVAVNTSVVVGILVSLKQLVCNKGISQEHMTALKSLNSGLIGYVLKNQTCTTNFLKK